MIDSRNEAKNTCTPMITSVAATSASRSSESAPKPSTIQRTTTTSADDEAGGPDPGTEGEPVLEPEARAQRVEPAVALTHVVSAVRLGAETEREDLHADDGQQRPGDQGVEIPQAPEQVQVATARAPRPAPRGRRERRRAR